MAAHARATPRELAEAVVLALCAGACLWGALTLAEGAYDAVAELFGETGLADYEVGRIEVGSLTGYSPVGAEPDRPFSWASIRGWLVGTLREHHRLLLGAAVGAVVGGAKWWSRSVARRAGHAFTPDERLRLRTDAGEE